MNWGMLGHEWAVDLLRQHVAQERMRHAYLFTGPQGVGRRTLALRLAQALNCLAPPAPGEQCGSCAACVRLQSMQHPDLAVVQAEQEGATLKVEQVRELQHTLALSPYEARYRVALLLRFEEAHPSAANALLKTLEEPPPQVVLLLTAESAESLLPTIVSRCEVLRLRPLAPELVDQSLQAQWGLPAERAHLLAHIAGGRPGYALRLNDNPEQMEQRQLWLRDLFMLLPANRMERFAYARALAEQKETLRDALLTWLSLWRDVLLCTAEARVALTNVDWAEAVQELAAHLDLVSARAAVSALEDTLRRLERNVNARLAVETLLLDLPQIRVSLSA